jgi:hypothetical protein
MVYGVWREFEVKKRCLWNLEKNLNYETGLLKVDKKLDCKKESL